MAEIIAHKYWMQLTNAGTLSIRGLALRSVDSALEDYHRQPGQAKLDKVKVALDKYKAVEPGWKSSIRNRYCAIDILTADLSGTSTMQLSPAEQVAWQMIFDESQTLLQRTFRGQKLEWREGILAKLGKQKIGLLNSSRNIVKNSLTIDGHANNGGQSRFSPMAMAQELYNEMVPVDIRSTVTQGLLEVMPDFLEELAASVAPFAGVLATGFSTIKSAGKSIAAEVKLRGHSRHAERAFTLNDPAHAAQALLQLLKRERNNQLVGLSINMTALTAKLAGVLADGGTASNAAVGLASSAVKLMNIIRIIATDCLERRAANNLMSGPRVTAAVFDECPILGAYMICCVPASALMNALFEKHAVVGWTGKAEFAWKHHWTPLRETASKLIKDHRFVIKALENHPGVLVAADKNAA